MVSIGPRIEIKGETHYRQAMRQIYLETENAKKAMDLMTASFNKNDTAMEKNRRTSEALSRVIDETKTKLQSQRSVYDELNRNIIATSDAYVSQTKTTERLKAEQDQQKQTVKDLTDQYGKNSKEVKDANEKLEKLNEQVTNSEKKETQLVAKTERLNTAQKDWQNRLVDTETELAKYQQQLQNVPNTLQTIGDELQKSGDKLQTWGDNLTKYVTTPLVALGTYGVKEAASFEDGMAKIYTIATESQKPMSQMREELIQLSRDTGYSLEDLAEAEYQAVSASVDTTKAVEFLGDATKLARAGFTTTTQSVDLLTTVINAYGMEAEDAAYISDVLLKTQNDGKTVIDELAQSMGTVIPTAANYNVSLEQLAGAYATMTKQGVNTSRATTFLNAMFTELEKESSDVSEILMNETGKSFAQLMGDGESLADVLKILYESVGEDNEQFQKLFGNIRSGKAAAALVNNNFETLNDEIERMGNASGQTAYALEVLDTPALKAKKALNQLKISAVDIGDTLISDFYPAFKDVVDAIKDATAWFHNLDDGTKSAIVKFGLFAAAVGPVFKVLGGGVSIIGKVASGIGGLQKTFALASIAFTNTSATASTFFAGLATGLPTILGVATAYIGVGYAAEAMMEAERDAINKQIGLTEEMKNTIAKVDALSASYKDLKQSLSDNIADAEANTVTTRALVTEYNSLVEANGLVDESNQAVADTILNELASALNTDLDGVKALIEENGKFGASMDEVIKHFEAEAKATAYKEMLVETVKQQTQAEQNYRDISAQVKEQTDKLTEAEKKADAAKKAYNDAVRNGSTDVENYRNTMNRAIQAESSARASLGQLQNKQAEARTSISKLNSDYQLYTDKIAEVTTGNMDKTATAVEGAADSFGDLPKEAKTALDKLSGLDADTPMRQVVNGLVSSLDKYKWSFLSAIGRLTKSATDKLNSGFRIASPSKVTQETGKYFVEGFAEGIKKNTYEALNAIQNFDSSVLGGFSDGYDAPTTNKTINAPINVHVTVSGGGDYAEIGDAIALRLDQWLGEQVW